MRTIQRDIVGAFIFSSDNKILLGRSRDNRIYSGLWIVPGGGIESGETKEEALIREIIEETGIDLSAYELEPLDEVLSGKANKILRDTDEEVVMDMKFYNYRIKLHEPADKVYVKTEDDFTDAQWFALSEIKALKLAAPSETTLQKWGYL